MNVSMIFSFLEYQQSKIKRRNGGFKNIEDTTDLSSAIDYSTDLQLAQFGSSATEVGASAFVAGRTGGGHEEVTDDHHQSF
jgi:hypothetical protein